MADGLHLWLRQEASAVEERAPVVPGDAAALVGSGIAVTVEEAPQRALPVEEYAAAGFRRAVHLLPSAPRGPFERALDRFETAVAEFRGE